MRWTTSFCFLFFLLAFNFESSSNEQSLEIDQERQEIIWVDYYTVPCEGVGSQLCLRVKQGENFRLRSWQYFYREIEGFNYQIGYRYKLRVNVRKNEHLREDESKLTYELDKVLEKRKVERKIKIEIFPGELIFKEDISAFFLIDTLQIEHVDSQQNSQLLKAITEEERLTCTFEILSNQRLKLLEIRKH